MKKFTAYIPFFCAFLFCGCEDAKHKPPPAERVSLAVRFFDSMEKRDIRSAVNQGRTILAMDQSQDNIRAMISAIESGTPLRQAQKKLDQHKFDEALQIVNNALTEELNDLRRYAGNKDSDFEQNQSLLDAQLKILQMKNAEQLLQEMKNADNSASMESALKSARTGLANIRTPQLDAFLDSYEIKLQHTAEKEKKSILAARDAASEAAEKAKKEDAAREAENLRFLQQRQDLGEIPFLENDPQKQDNKI